MGLNCYICASSSSWDDCEHRNMTCPKLSDRCIKVYLEHSDEEMYKKYCGIVGHCEKKANPTCNAEKVAGASECKIDCCEGNLCNGGSKPHANGMTMLVCAVAVLAFRNLVKGVPFTLWCRKELH